jgi:hypothetical protein
MSDAKQIAKLEFVSFCIEQYKKTTNKSGKEVEQLFEKHGVISFLFEHYEILHTQSAQSIQIEIEEYLKNHPL